MCKGISPFSIANKMRDYYTSEVCLAGFHR